MEFFVTGDFHGDFIEFSNRLNKYFNFNDKIRSNCGIVILGDASINYFNDARDVRPKQAMEELGFTYYLVRGNHELRPQNLNRMKEIFDENVNYNVLYEERFPHIRYLIDGGVYWFNNIRALVIGGAYSVDKFYRQAIHKPWFPEEQLTKEEMSEIVNKFSGQEFDLILSHTCPYSWMPRDLFLTMVDQSKVDNTMELWLDTVRQVVMYKGWLFGHFHGNRYVRPRVEMFYTNVDSLSEVYERCAGLRDHNPYYKKDPNYFFEGDS